MKRPTQLVPCTHGIGVTWPPSAHGWRAGPASGPTSRAPRAQIAQRGQAAPGGEHGVHQQAHGASLGLEFKKDGGVAQLGDLHGVGSEASGYAVDCWGSNTRGEWPGFTISLPFLPTPPPTPCRRPLPTRPPFAPGEEDSPCIPAAEKLARVVQVV